MSPSVVTSSLSIGREPSTLRQGSIESGVSGKFEPLNIGSSNGFIWHTTGRVKTLTSFEASTDYTLRDTLLPKLLLGELSTKG